MTQIAEISSADVVHTGDDGSVHCGNSRANKTGRRASLLWGLSSGTVLSVAGFVALTLYQQYNDTFAELRKDLRQLTIASGEHLKRDEMRGQMSNLWGVVKDLNAGNIATGKELQSAKAGLVTQAERIAYLEDRLKAGEEDRKELVREIQRLRERLASVEGRQAVIPPKSSQ